MADNAPESSNAERLKGIFSRDDNIYIGSGTSRRKTLKTLYFFAEEIEEDKMEVRAVNGFFLPIGNPTVVNLAEFIQKHRPELELYQTKTLPALNDLAKTLAKAERLRNRGEQYTAEVEYQKALKMDETNVRGTFGLGLTYLDRGENQKAADLLKKLVKIEEAFHPDNKHMFNEFGIKLRKNKMYDQALAYYASAYKTSNRDENLLYNIARTLFDKGDFENGLKYITKALELCPDFEEGLKLKAALERKLRTAATCA